MDFRDELIVMKQNSDYLKKIVCNSYCSNFIDCLHCPVMFVTHCVFETDEFSKKIDSEIQKIYEGNT